MQNILLSTHQVEYFVEFSHFSHTVYKAYILLLLRVLLLLRLLLIIIIIILIVFIIILLPLWMSIYSLLFNFMQIQVETFPLRKLNKITSLNRSKKLYLFMEKKNIYFYFPLQIVKNVTRSI